MKIDVEAHYYDPRYVAYLAGRALPPREEPVGDAIRMYVEPSAPEIFQQRSKRLQDALADVGDQRIAAMDAAAVDIQVLSLNIPGCEQIEPIEGAAVARDANDALAEIVVSRPGRYIGLAALCPDPDAPEIAADELERCVTKLGFRGLKINSHIRDTTLDDPRYRPIFARAAALGVPVCLHPTIPHVSMVRPYQGYGYMLMGPALGFAAETALQAMRLIYSGVFDEHPELQVVLGHLGEGLYFWLYRLDFEFTKPWLARDPRILCSRRPSDYLRENFWPTTSGHFQRSAFLATHMEVGGGRLLFASDYPYESSEQAVELVRDAPIPASDKDRIFSENAAALFGIERRP